MQIKRQFSIELNDEYLFFRYKVNELSDKQTDYFSCNSNEYYIKVIPNVIIKYAIISESAMIIPDSEMHGYIFACTLNKKVSDPSMLRNLSQRTHINNGSRIVYFTENPKLAKLNDVNGDDMYHYFYTTNKITGIINIRITKNINYLSSDKEFFKPMIIANAYSKKNYITKYGQTANNANR